MIVDRLIQSGLTAASAVVMWLRMDLGSDSDGKLLKRAADTLGLSRSGPKIWSSDHFKWTGTVQGVCVTLSPGRAVGHEFRVELSRRFPGLRLRLGRPSLFQDYFRCVETGDAAFDKRTRVEGELMEVLAALGENTRLLVNDLMKFGRLEIGELTTSYLTRRKDTPSAELLVERIHRLVALDEAIASPAVDPSTRLAENALTDSVPLVRLANFEQLISLYSGRELTNDVAVNLLKSQDPQLKLLAAIYLDDARGWAVMRTLATQQGLDVELREIALVRLCDKSPASESLPVLRQICAESESPAVLRTAAMREIARLKLRELLPLLLSEVGKADDATLAVLAEAIGAIGDPSSEGALLSRLAVEDTDARVAVVKALGLVASTAAVDDLLPLAHGIGLPGSVTAAAREAIARIQSRLLGAAEGQLSISDPAKEVGALSLSDTQGALSEPSPRQSPARPQPTERDREGHHA